MNPTDNKVIGKVTMADEIDTRKAFLNRFTVKCLQRSHGEQSCTGPLGLRMGLTDLQAQFYIDPGKSIVITAYELAGRPLAAFRRRRRKKQQMSQEEFPTGWSEDKVRRVLAHYEQQNNEDALLEDEAGIEPSETVMNVSHDLVLKVRELIAKLRS